MQGYLISSKPPQILRIDQFGDTLRLTNTVPRQIRYKSELALFANNVFSNTEGQVVTVHVGSVHSLRVSRKLQKR